MRPIGIGTNAGFLYWGRALTNQGKMFKKDNIWSDELARAIDCGKEEAVRLELAEIDSGCLLLGMMRTECRATVLLRHYGVATDEKMEELKKSLTIEDRHQNVYYSAAFEAPALSVECQRLLRLSTLEARRSGAKMILCEHLLLGILHDGDNKARVYLNAEGITYRRVAESLNIRPEVRSGFGFAEEEGETFPSGGDKNGRPGTKSQSPEDASATDTPMIDNFGVDLTRKAEEGILDPVVGREKETLRMVQILVRRKKNNPVLIGEPGVGKSAVVEGLAQLIVNRKAPRALLDKRVVALDMAAVVAGTQFRGQFEERLRRLIEELRQHKEIILFVDEIHTIIGAGSAAGTLDAANILKPALARGEVQCIGATTLSEYRKTIEKDGALERRFQKVMLEPATAEETLIILRNLRSRYEEHHSVCYTEEALEACVVLTERYVNDRSLPDKAIDAMDEAGSRVRLASVSVPKEIIEKEKEIEELKQRKTEAAKKQDYEEAAHLRDTVIEQQRELERMNSEWQSTQRKDCSTVNAEDVAEIVSMMSGVPAGRMVTSETERLRSMKTALQKKVIAQDEAVEKVVRAITRNRIGLKDSNRPIGTFMFVGPTGVGKTHLVKCLADWMFDRKDALIRVDMSEYGEKYSTSRLVGAPPGYVGYEEGGQLTEKVRRHPYSVILLDEIEKAHPDVFNTLLQVMDEGRMTDGNGTTVDFRNTIIIMTSNSGTRQLGEFGSGIGFNAESTTEAMADGIIRKSLRRQFAPEFLNRLDDIIVFRPLNKESAVRIALLEIEALRTRMKAMGLELEISSEAIDFIVGKGFDSKYGARSLKRAIQIYLEDKICDMMMSENPPAGNLKFLMENGNLVTA